MALGWIVLWLLLQAQPEVWQGRVLFELKPGFSIQSLPEELESLRVWVEGQVRPRFPSLPSKSPIYLLEYERRLSPLYVAKLWRQSPAVLYAEPEYIPKPLSAYPAPKEDPQRLTYEPNDLHPDNHCLSHLRILSAWDSTKGDTTVAVAIVDTDVRWDHPDLVENIAYNWNDPINGVDDDGDGYVDNFHGWDIVGTTYSGSGPFSGDNDPRLPGWSAHGTWVAGFAGATTDNGIGIAAPAFRCRLLPIKAGPDDNPDWLFGAYDGILYAAQKGAKVINCSWGGTFYSQAAQNFISQILNTYDPLIVAAAGNVPPDTPTKFYPAQYEGVLSITAVNPNDVWEGWVQIGYDIDLSATGSGITLSGLSDYVYWGSFTSFSSPQAAGAAVLLRSWRPDLNARQITELLRLTADSVEPFNPSHLRYRLGRRINLQRAVATRDTPACRVRSWRVFDQNDDLLFANETFFLTAVYTNYLSSATNLSVTIESLSPHVEVLQGTYVVGSLPALQTHTQASPFALRVLPSCPPNTRLPVLFRFVADGGYADYQVIEIPWVNPSYVHLDSAQIRTTLCGNGRIGYYDSPQNTQGRGILWASLTQSLLASGGLVISDDTSAHLSTQAPFGAMYDHFVPMNAATHTADGLYERGLVRFMDSRGLGLNSPDGIAGKGLSFEAHGYAIRRHPANTFVACLYRIENTSSQTYPNLCIGWWLDLDLGNNPVFDHAFVHPTLPLVYARNNSQTRFVGAVLLSGHASIKKIGRMDTFSATLPAYLGIMRSSSSVSSLNGDVFIFIGAQDVSLLPGGVDTVAFALVGGYTLAELELRAQEALNWYACFTQGSAPLVDLGEDRLLCLGDSLHFTSTSTGEIVWSTEETTPAIVPTTDGLYWLLLRDADGCWGYDEVYITVHRFAEAEVSFEPGLTVSVGETLTVRETSGLPYRYIWLLGDSVFEGPELRYVFAETGIYTLWLYRESQGCRDTLRWEITVQSPASLSQPISSAVEIHPNPTGDRFSLTYRGNELLGERFSLYNALGEQVWEVFLRESGAMYGLPSALPPGPYFWRVGKYRGILLHVP
ncbi:MAG: S8 family serine peptidase [Bacteroidia bacterium]|nr:S8 family serine peptidase [Bacteroidia bacterium]MDW8015396.1 S8 family serine peptidase [Bacteroidia bacterium]